MNIGKNRKELFNIILGILEECSAIKYAKTGYFTKENFLQALIQSDTSTFKAMGYSKSDSLAAALLKNISKEILDYRRDFLGNNVSWDKYLLYLVDYRYCKKCNLCYKLKDFSYNNKDKYKKAPYCKTCSNNISKENRKGNKEEISKYKKEYQILNKNKLADKKLTKRKESVLYLIDLMAEDNKLPECSICGYKNNWAVLELHHIDSSLERPNWSYTKEGNKRNPSNYLLGCSITEMRRRYLYEKDNLELLCANCHREQHNIQWENII